MKSLKSQNIPQFHPFPRHVALPSAETRRFCRRVGCHAAWATAWHNGHQVSYAEAERAWGAEDGTALEEKLGGKTIGKWWFNGN